MDKKLSLFFLISIFMLANGAFFNWVFHFVGLVVWRQVIFVIGLSILILKAKTFWGMRRVLKPYINLFFIILILSLFTLVDKGFSPVRIGYANWVYFAGLPFVIFIPLAYRSGWSQEKLNYIFITLGLFQTVGIIVDYMLGGLITKSFLFLNSYEISQEDIMKTGRFCFLSESPTIFSIYYCLCLTCCFFQLVIERGVVRSLVLYGFAASFIVGAWFTGSRQLVVILLIVFVIDSFLVFRKNKVFRVGAVALSIIFVLIATSLSNFLFQEAGYSDRYSSDSVKGDSRYELWKKGWEECVISPTFRRLTIGDGVGYVIANGADKNEEFGNHYENTFFARMSEIGLVLGLVSILLPIVTIIKKGKRAKGMHYLHIPFCLSFLFISYVSPNGASTTTQMSVFVFLGMVLSQSYTIKDLKKQ